MYLEKLKRPVISNGESNTLKLKLIVNLFISLSFEDEPIDLCSISTKEVLWTLLNKKNAADFNFYIWAMECTHARESIEV